MTTERQYEHPMISYFLAHQDDRAMLAALRRGLGARPGDAPDLLPYVVPFVTRSGWTEESLYLVASLFGLHPLNSSTGNLGAHIRQIDPTGDNSEAIERRFTALLRASSLDLAVPLRQMISLLKSKDIPVNWHQLLSDVLSWNDPDRRRNVTRYWAASFWTSKKS